MQNQTDSHGGSRARGGSQICIRAEMRKTGQGWVVGWAVRWLEFCGVPKRESKIR